MQSSNILCLLIAAAACIGSLAHSLHHRNYTSQGGKELDIDSLNELIVLRDEVEQLKKENIGLRDMAKVNGDFIIPSSYLKFVEQDTGLTFTKPLSVFYGSDEAITKAAMSEWSTSFGEEGMAIRAHYFHLIGLMPPNSLLDQLAISMTGPGTARAIYDYEHKHILLPQNFDVEHTHDASELIRLLTIIIAEQNYSATKGLDDDSWIARRTIIHANALITRQKFMTEFAQKMSIPGSVLEPIVSKEITSQGLATFNAMPAYVQQLIILSNTTGRQFIESNKQTSRKLTLEASLEKAQNTHSIYTNTKHVKPDLITSKNTVFSTSLGYLGILVHANSTEGETIKKPHQLAQKYLSDHLTTQELPDRIYQTQWLINFTDASSAQQFAEHLHYLFDDFSDSHQITANKTQVQLLITEKPLAE